MHANVRIFFFYRCDCGWFAQSQVDDFYIGGRQPSPLFGFAFFVDPYTCTLPPGGINDCKTQCQNWADEILADGFNLCRRTPIEGNPRCWGGFMCENLNTEGFPNVSKYVNFCLNTIKESTSYVPLSTFALLIFYLTKRTS